MAYLIAIVILVALLVAFLVLVGFEERSGKRLLAGRRYMLDGKVERVSFILQHVDWGAFSADVARSSIERAAHDIAHGSLIAVRALERFLTRVVRTLRTRRDVPLPPPSVSRTTATVTYLKRAVQRTRRKSMDIDIKS
ncbi:MAG: hypothetical protein JWN49_58 [Parcubacteria group bacterium]|nr:hypothetical protein [Parcubacteria group bacterium]